MRTFLMVLGSFQLGFQYSAEPPGSQGVRRRKDLDGFLSFNEKKTEIAILPMLPHNNMGPLG